MNIWTPEEEAERLAARFAKVNRAAFVRTHKIKGGQAIVYQHITGRRPIGLDAALGYADGFGVGLEEISPRLALVAAKGAIATGPQLKLPAASQEPDNSKLLVELVSLFLDSLPSARVEILQFARVAHKTKAASVNSASGN